MIIQEKEREMENIRLSIKQIQMMKHAYGADSKEPGYRTHYCISLDDLDMVEMVEMELFQKPIGIGTVRKTHGIFHLSDKGIEYLKKIG